MSEHPDTVQRLDWYRIPQTVRAAVENRLGQQIMSAFTQPGGFSHGAASRLHLADGRRVFVKAIGIEDELAAMYRSEAATARRLPAAVPAPRWRFTIDEAGWLVMVFDDIDGHYPRLDRPDELATVLGAVEQIATALTPTPIPDAPTVTELYSAAFTGWREFAEHGPPADLDPWARRHLDRLATLETSCLDQAGHGTTLLHTDLRPDNLLVRADGGGVAVVDWAWTCVGAAWVDLLILAPWIAAAGIDPDPILATHPVTADLDPGVIDAFLCAMTGNWARDSRRPAPPRSPRLRPHQARAEQISTRWLRRRLRWP